MEKRPPLFADVFALEPEDGCPVLDYTGPDLDLIVFAEGDAAWIDEAGRVVLRVEVGRA
jgi:hypothetical protein